MSIAIVVITYNRINSLKRLLSSLEKAQYKEDVTLIISIDKSNTDLVEKYADEFVWCFGQKIVNKHQNNLGLKAHILSVGNWLEKFDAIIVLEDDLVVSPFFYQYAKQTVSKYAQEEKVAGISLYSFAINYQNGLPFEPIKDNHDVFFMQCAMSWGQIWMRNAWSSFMKWYEFNKDFSPSPIVPRALYKFGEKSWLKYHTRYCIENDLFFVYPYTSLSTNFSDQGTNHKNIKGVNPTVNQVRLQNGNGNIVYNLPLFCESNVKYDGFFENLGLYESLGISKQELCLDLNCENQNICKRKFWLTTIKQDYKVLKSFGLAYKPIEENVIQQKEGQDIFLYDTTVKEKNKFNHNVDRFLFLYRIGNMVQLLRQYGIRKVMIDFGYSFIRKILRICY